ncbi:hypothetical protein BOO92_15995 [Vibrio navarrensis]|uniref:hypothetical protein n=1 Tax=Vibrio navarrensis TaxID=29495 RepID=UPI00186646EB|nr:hypothetical protein [Vibrio navarrensis]MBE3658180.1 hypothetical protein [Vibrio navarrensis]
MKIYLITLAFIFGILRAPALVYALVTGLCVFLITKLVKVLGTLALVFLCVAMIFSPPIVTSFYAVKAGVGVSQHFEQLQYEILRVTHQPLYTFETTSGLALLGMGFLVNGQELDLTASAVSFEKGVIRHRDFNAEPNELKGLEDWPEEKVKAYIEKGKGFIILLWLTFLASRYGHRFAKVIRALFVRLGV